MGTLLSEVQSKKVRWLWQRRLPLGKLTTLDGGPCLGKSHLALDIAARVSSGQDMPDGTPGIVGGAGVVLIAPDDGLADTIQPRLQRAGADLSRIVSIGTLPITDSRGNYSYDRPFQLSDDLWTLAEVVRHVQAKLVVIGGSMTIFGNKGNSKDKDKDTEVRAALQLLQMLTEYTGAACLIVGQLTKGDGSTPLPRTDGSMVYITTARSGLIVLKDPTDESKRVLAHVKSNLSAQAASLSFSIVSDEDSADTCPSIHWQGECTQTLQELLNTPVFIQPLGTTRQEILMAWTSYPRHDTYSFRFL